MTNLNQSSAFGLTLAFASNLVLLLSNYAVKLYNLPTADISFWKGLLQIVAFTVLLALMRKSPVVKDVMIWIIGFALAGGLKSVSYFGAVTKIPLTEFTILTSTTPMFSLILSKLVLGTKVTLLKIFFCFTVILGVVLVVYPSLRAHHQESLALGQVVVGVGLAMVFALSAAFTNVVPPKCPGTNVTIFMVWNGVGSLGVALLAPLMGMKMTWMEKDNDLDLVSWILIVSAGIGLILVNVLLVQANKLSTPTVVSMIRRMDVVLVVLVEVSVFKVVPDVVVLVGAGIVMLSVVGITLAEKIESKISILCQQHQGLEMDK